MICSLISQYNHNISGKNKIAYINEKPEDLRFKRCKIMTAVILLKSQFLSNILRSYKIFAK